MEIVVRNTGRSVEDTLDDIEVEVIGSEVVDIIRVNDGKLSKIVEVEIVEIPDAVEVNDAEEEPVGIVNVDETDGAIAIVADAGEAELEDVRAGIRHGAVDEVGKE